MSQENLRFGHNLRPLNSLTGCSQSALLSLPAGYEGFQPWVLRFPEWQERGEEDGNVRELRAEKGDPEAAWKNLRLAALRHYGSEGCRLAAGEMQRGQDGGPHPGPASPQPHVPRKDRTEYLSKETWGLRCQLSEAITVGGCLSGKVPEKGEPWTAPAWEQPWCTGLATMLMYKLGSLCHTSRGEKFPSSNVKLKIRHYMGASRSVKSAD